MSLRTALAHFIQNKFYLQCIFIILLQYFSEFFKAILARKAYRCKNALKWTNFEWKIVFT